MYESHPTPKLHNKLYISNISQILKLPFSISKYNLQTQKPFLTTPPLFKKIMTSRCTRFTNLSFVLTAVSAITALR